MKRRQFTVEAAMLLLGGAAITISGCGGGASPTASSAPLVDKSGAISSNHGHLAVVTGAEQGEGGSLDLDIRGTATHTHTVSLSAADVVSIRNGARVEKESSGTSHTHTVTFNG
jgi:hypothetical protein